MKLKSFYLICLFCCMNIFLYAEGSETCHIEEYLRFLHAFEDHLGPTGDYTKGEIQIVVDPEEIKPIEENYRQKLIRRGVNAESALAWSKVGIIDSDSVWLWVRDAVIMPSGRKTIRDRMTWKSAVDGPQGVATLPLLGEKKILTCLAYKHATRSWQLELPRGVRLFGENAEKASRRQLHSTTGYSAKKQLYLGSLVPDSSSFNTLTPVFLSYIDEKTEPIEQLGESVIGLMALTKNEIKDAYLKGHVELDIHGENTKVAVNDSFLAYAIFQAEIRGLI